MKRKKAKKSEMKQKNNVEDLIINKEKKNKQRSNLIV